MHVCACGCVCRCVYGHAVCVRVHGASPACMYVRTCVWLVRMHVVRTYVHSVLTMRAVTPSPSPPPPHTRTHVHPHTSMQAPRTTRVASGRPSPLAASRARRGRAGCSSQAHAPPPHTHTTTEQVQQVQTKRHRQHDELPVACYSPRWDSKHVCADARSVHSLSLACGCAWPMPVSRDVCVHMCSVLECASKGDAEAEIIFPSRYSSMR